MLYKWRVQFTVWEIAKACEFSCDEAILTKEGCENAQDYGKTLLNAMAAVGKYREILEHFGRGFHWSLSCCCGKRVKSGECEKNTAVAV